jgi:hypothetical protein
MLELLDNSLIRLLIFILVIYFAYNGNLTVSISLTIIYLLLNHYKNKQEIEKMIENIN